MVPRVAIRRYRRSRRVSRLLRDIITGGAALTCRLAAGCYQPAGPACGPGGHHADDIARGSGAGRPDPVVRLRRRRAAGRAGRGADGRGVESGGTVRGRLGACAARAPRRRRRAGGAAGRQPGRLHHLPPLRLHGRGDHEPRPGAVLRRRADRRGSPGADGHLQLVLRALYRQRGRWLRHPPPRRQPQPERRRLGLPALLHVQRRRQHADAPAAARRERREVVHHVGKAAGPARIRADRDAPASIRLLPHRVDQPRDDRRRAGRGRAVPDGVHHLRAVGTHVGAPHAARPPAVRRRRADRRRGAGDGPELRQLLRPVLGERGGRVSRPPPHRQRGSRPERDGRAAILRADGYAARAASAGQHRRPGAGGRAPCRAPSSGRASASERRATHRRGAARGFRAAKTPRSG